MKQPRSDTSTIPQPEATGWGVRKPNTNSGELETRTAIPSKATSEQDAGVLLSQQGHVTPAISYYNITLYLFSQLFFIHHLFP